MNGRAVIAFVVDVNDEDDGELLEEFRELADDVAGDEDWQTRNGRAYMAVGGHAAALELMLSRKVDRPDTLDQGRTS